MRPTAYREAWGNRPDGNRWYPQPDGTPRLLVVIHDSEQAEDVNQADDADQLAAALALPGTRSNGYGGTYGSGYHAVTDSAPFGYLQIAPWTARVNAAPPLNGQALHVCLPERVGYSVEQWIASRHVDATAAFLLDVAETYGVPTVRLSPSQMVLDAQGRYIGARGYCGHVDVSRAFGQTDHTDPGSNFPWDVLHGLLTPNPTPPPPVVLTGDSNVVEIWYSTPAADGKQRIVLTNGFVARDFADNASLARLLQITPPLGKRSNVPLDFLATLPTPLPAYDSTP